MKRSLLCVAAFSLASLVGNANTNTKWLSESFLTDSDALPAGWLSEGVDSSPAGTYASYFRNYSASSAFAVLAINRTPMATSPSEMADGQLSDQWLISPEIEVPTDDAMLTYTVGVLGNKTKNKFAIYYSENGTDRAAFEANPVYSSSVVGKGDDAPVIQTKRASLSGMKGKKIRLAFVNTGNATGLVGFTDIQLAQYEIAYDEAAFKSIAVKSDQTDISFPVRISTPIKTPGLTATLTLEDGSSATFSTDISFSSSSLYTCTLDFENVLDMSGKSTIGYTLEVTPAFEGALPTVIEGVLVAPSYPGVAVMEEYTGTWCPNCPRGTAFMNYYHDKYAMAEGKGRFIGMALHVSDPMQPDYLPQVMTICPVPGEPYAWLNRKDGNDVQYVDVEGAQSELSVGEVKIARVDMADADASTLTVNYGARICFDMDVPNVAVAAYILENNVEGDNAEYVQENNYAGMSEETIAQAFGEDLVPYFKPFIDQTIAIIPYTEIKYNEVARAVSPSVAGLELRDMQAHTYQKGVIEMAIPSSVMNREEIEVVVLMTDLADNSIIGADVVKFENFNKDVFDVPEGPVVPPTGNVAFTNAGDFSFTVENGLLSLSTPEDGVLTLYAADGSVIMQKRLESGSATVPVTACGLVIASFRTANVVKSAKLLF